MNWDAIGAIGELLAALGVLASLLYLASQIRMNNKMTWSQNVHTRTDRIMRVLELQLHPEIRKSLGNAFNPSKEILPADFIPLETLVGSALAAFYDDFQHHQAGLLDDAAFDIQRKIIAAFLVLDWGASLWEEHFKRHYPPDFAEEVAVIIEKGEIDTGVYGRFRSRLLNGDA